MVKLILGFLSFMLLSNQALGLANQSNIFIVQNKELLSVKLQYDGIVIPQKISEIISPSNVVVKKKFFQFGDNVKKSQLLFELSSPELLNQLTQAKMDLLENKEKVKELKNWQSSTQFLKVKTELNRAEQALAHAKDRFLQTKKLYEAGIVSKEEFLADKRMLEENRQHHENAKQYVVEVKEKVGAAALALAQMKLSQCENTVEILNQKVLALTPRSPIEGMILPPPKEEKQLGFNEYQTTFKENQVLATIAEKNNLIILVKVDEFDIVKIHQGLRAQIKLSSYSHIPLEGSVQEINLKTNASKENNKDAVAYEVKILIEKIPELLKDKILLGMSATVKFKQTLQNGLFVPKNAIIYENETAFVSLMLNENKIIKTPVDLGEVVEDDVLISKGLKAGDRIILFS